MALAHDWLVGMRGGERVLDAIARVVRESAEVDALYTMFDDGRTSIPGIEGLEKVVWPVGARGFAATRARRWLLPAYPRAIAWLSRELAERHRSRPIDLLISTSSAAIQGLAAPAGVAHLCYCHAPARYVWSQGEAYARGSPLKRAGLALFGRRFREWDRARARVVTRFLANSTHTARQIGEFYARDAGVLHPPVDTAYFGAAPARERRGWLVVSALEPYKRVDLAIDAAEIAGERLTIIGEGTQGRRLRARAGKGVEFLGRVTRERLREAYAGASCLLFPQVEDFGIAAAEALAAGCPVVARRAGGALDIVEEGVTGAFFEGDGTDLARAAGRCPVGASDACRLAAARFDRARFESSLAGLVGEMLARA